MGEDVKGYLASNGIGQRVVGELFLESLDQCGPVAVFLQQDELGKSLHTRNPPGPDLGNQVVLECYIND